MIDISNTTSSAFREPPGSVTAGMVPTFSMAPLAGGLGFAKIESKWRAGDELGYLIVRDADLVERQIPGLKYVARCLGLMRQSELIPCSCADADSFDALIAAHASLQELAKRNEVHVLCAWSPEPWDPEGYAEQMANYEAHVKQVKKLEKDGEMMNAAILREKLGWPRNRIGLPPQREIVGFFVSQAMSGKWMHAHDRVK